MLIQEQRLAEPPSANSCSLPRSALWRQCRARGLIPGPLETPELFLERVQEAVSLSRPFCLQPFQVSPDWIVPQIRSSALRPWEGAATLIEQKADGSLHTEIHIGKSLLMETDWLVAHEWVHAIRCGFPDSVGEEILAWQTCPQRALRLLSLLAIDPLQLSSFCGALFGFMMGWTLDWAWGIVWSLTLISLSALRAWRTVRPYQLAHRMLQRADLPGWPLLLHLSHDEIIALSKGSDAFWPTFAQKNHFRFEFLQACFAMLRSN